VSDLLDGNVLINNLLDKLFFSFILNLDLINLIILSLDDIFDDIELMIRPLSLI